MAPVIDAWYSEAFLTNGHVGVPPTVPPTVPPAPIVLANGVAAAGGQARDDAQDDQAGVPAPTTQSLASLSSHELRPDSKPEPWNQYAPRPEAWPPHADALPSSEPAPQLPPGQFPPGPFPPYQQSQYPQYSQGQYPQEAFPAEQSWQIAPGTDPDGEARRVPFAALVAGALALVVLTATGLWWLNSRNSDRVSAASSPNPAAVATSAPSTVPAGEPTSTASAAAEPAPGSSSPSSSSPSPEASGDDVTEVFTTMDGLLDRSTQARGQVGSTAVALQSCQVDAGDAAKVFRDAGAERKQLSSKATGLSSSAGLAGVSGAGDAIRSFIALQDASAQADDALAAWAGEVGAQGCSGRAPRTGNLDAANRFSAQASAAKARFVKIWNPIAAERGLDSRSADQI